MIDIALDNKCSFHPKNINNFYSKTCKVCQETSSVNSNQSGPRVSQHGISKEYPHHIKICFLWEHFFF